MMQQTGFNGARVERDATGFRLMLAAIHAGYCNAQIDDYSGTSLQLRHRAPISLSCHAGFSLSDPTPGTAGFGFWNAPYGDRLSKPGTLPQACWFFYAGGANSLPFTHNRRGWFACTISITPLRLLLLPLLLPLIVLHNVPQRPGARRLNRWLKRRWGVRARALPLRPDEQRRYRLDWLHNGCLFFVDDTLQFAADVAPAGPLGFVAWLDNQYLVAQPNGRFGWGTSAIAEATSLKVDELSITPLPALL